MIPRILLAALGQSRTFQIFGTDYPTPDGTCVRDYVHVEDLASAHLLALEQIRANTQEIFNLGSEKGFSVREVIEACSKIIGKYIPTTEEARRTGDPATLISDSKKIREILRWSPQYPDLETIVRHAWQWHTTHPHGYEDLNYSEIT